MTKSKRYTKEFKLDAVRLVDEQGYRAAEAARNLGLNANLLNRWVNEYRRDECDVFFRGHGKLSGEQVELRRLREENRRLKLEREILKKRWPSSRKNPAEISVHCPTEEGLFGEIALPSDGYQPLWVLRLRAGPTTGARS